MMPPNVYLRVTSWLTPTKLLDRSLPSAAGWHMVSWCGLVWELQDTWRLQVTWLSCAYACMPLLKSPWEQLTHGVVRCSGLSTPGNLEIPGNTTLLCWLVLMAFLYWPFWSNWTLAEHSSQHSYLFLFNLLPLVILHCWFLAMMRTFVHRYQVILDLDNDMWLGGCASKS